MGDLAVKKAAMSVTESVDVDIDSRSIMGVVVPIIDSEIQERTIVERGYGFMDTSVKVDEAAKSSKNQSNSLLNWEKLKKQSCYWQVRLNPLKDVLTH